MQLEQLSYIAEITAAILVIVSLVYVGIQVRQNTAALKLSTAQNLSEDFTDIYLALSQNNDTAGIFQRGLQDYDSLESVEKVRFYAFFHKFFRIYENAYYQYVNGALEEEPFEGISNQLVMLGSMPGLRSYWNDRKSFYNSRFQAFVDESVMTDNGVEFTLAGTR